MKPPSRLTAAAFAMSHFTPGRPSFKAYLTAGVSSYELSCFLASLAVVVIFFLPVDVDLLDCSSVAARRQRK